MTYEKTVWDNDVTPVDETNMNKIEDGLFNQDARITGVESGWTVAPGTWTYASASRINTSVDMRTILGVGDKVKYTQTSNIKYGYIIAITATYIDVTGGTDYTVASATITSPYYSHQESPLGFPQVFNYAINITVEAGSTSPTYYGKVGTFQLIGKRIVGNFHCYNYSGGTGGNGTGLLLIQMPILPNYTNPDNWNGNIIGSARLYEESGTTNMCPLVYLNGLSSCGVGMPTVVDFYKANDQSSANRHIVGNFSYFIA